ncbi:MAG: T9SS type A sorting domain-containing protein [candidate division KSB1 bacterium]|nr:T9SS type A sorting domain-containing protein [candidate division KSB1 bacterium]
MNCKIKLCNDHSLNPCRYYLTDRRIEERDYYYKIKEVSITGTSSYYGPVHVVGQQLIPSAYALSQNYPNPFNPSTRIAYQLPVECKVRIDVININGKRVRRLLDSKVAAGYHSAVWDGTDETGQNVHSGVYFIRLRTPDFQRTRKMMLVH